MLIARPVDTVDLGERVLRRSKEERGLPSFSRDGALRGLECLATRFAGKGETGASDCGSGAKNGGDLARRRKREFDESDT